MFLRATLGTGSALVLPSILAGCDKDKGPSATTSSDYGPSPSPAAASTSVQAASAEGGGTVPKAQAKYQEQPKGDQSCANCQQFVAGTSTCRVVEGRVSPQGWCMFWAKEA
jgi:hypothetical protein